MPFSLASPTSCPLRAHLKTPLPGSPPYFTQGSIGPPIISSRKASLCSQPFWLNTQISHKVVGAPGLESNLRLTQGVKGAWLWLVGGLTMVGLLTGSACSGEEALLWMLPRNGPQDSPSARLCRARTRFCPSCRTCSSSSVGRDISGIRSTCCGDYPALLPAQVQPTSVGLACRSSQGAAGHRREGLPSYRDGGWCLASGSQDSPCGKTVPGDNGLQR